MIHRLIHTPLILASQSQSRRQILTQVKISFKAISSEVDEEPLKKKAKDELKTPGEAAMILAISKAQAVNMHNPQALVLGVDQLMQCEERWFDKAQTIDKAIEQLKFLRGKPHILETAACLIFEGNIVWQELHRPSLVMRSFSDDFLQWYIDKMGENMLQSLGCYQVEGYGFHLFDKIDGDLFTIMGLPMMALMSPLRQWGIVSS